MTHCLRFFAITVVVFAATWLAACSSDDPGPSPPPAVAPTPLSYGGEPPTYPEPVVVASGEYLSPAGFPDARENGAAAELAEAGEPTFEGKIEGITLRKMAPGAWPNYCGDADFAKFDPTDMLKFDYFPPGTTAITPQYGATCPDGTQPVVAAEYMGSNFMFEVYFRRGDRVVLHDAPESRVSAVTIGGLSGVAVQPVVANGYGSSQIAWGTPSGMLQVAAFDLPFDEVTKIAEGIQCASC